jgi:hypothetical protein
MQEEFLRYRTLTPTEKFQALCDKMDRLHAFVESDPAAREKYERYRAAKERERKLFREWWSQMARVGKYCPPPAWEDYPSLDELFPSV